MSGLAKFLLIAVMIMSGFCTPILAVEPNQPKEELQFTVSDVKLPWLQIGTRSGKPSEKASGPIRPNYVAMFYVQGGSVLSDLDLNFDRAEEMKLILSSSAGQKMSKKQKEFIEATDPFCVLSSPYRTAFGGHRQHCFYAVSEDDAKKMVEGFVEFINNQVNIRKQSIIQQQQEFQKAIDDGKKKLAEKEEELKAANAKFQEMKKNLHYSSYDDGEARDEAKKTIFEMNKIIDGLNIDLAGINSKIKEIAFKLTSINKEIVANKLTELQVETTVELKSAEAKKIAAEKMRDQAEVFYNSAQHVFSLENEIFSLKGDENHKGSITEKEEKLGITEYTLENYNSAILFNSEITIHPVLAGEQK